MCIRQVAIQINHGQRSSLVAIIFQDARVRVNLKTQQFQSKGKAISLEDGEGGKLQVRGFCSLVSRSITSRAELPDPDDIACHDANHAGVALQRCYEWMMRPICSFSKA